MFGGTNLRGYLGAQLAVFVATDPEETNGANAHQLAALLLRRTGFTLARLRLLSLSVLNSALILLNESSVISVSL